MKAIELIEAQQQGKENSPAWMLGEQLKDICRAETESAMLVEADLQQKGMGLDDAEKKLKALADSKKQKGSNCVCITLKEAEKVLREFYGLPAKQGAEDKRSTDSNAAQALDLSSFF